MPYLVLHDEELSAKTALGGRDRPRSDLLAEAFNAMENDGYTLVTIQSADGEQGGTSYVFHRPAPAVP
jgi:phage replication-related protein YjqB (UPF0714/DUF867 family)